MSFNPEWFIGVVEKVEAAGNGRLKVRAFGYHPSAAENIIQTDDLPWAWIVNTNFNKAFMWPEVGQVVLGFFMDGRDAQRPMIVGAVSGGIYSSMPYDVGGVVDVPEIQPLTTTSMDPCEAYNSLLSTGLDHNQAIGVLVNMHRESNLNPNVYEYGGGGGIGLFQYTYPSRKSAFESAVPDWKTNPVGQINYAINEDPLGRSYKSRKFATAAEAADWFTLEFENPADSIKNQYVGSRGGSGNSKLVEDYEKRISQCVVASSKTVTRAQ